MKRVAFTSVNAGYLPKAHVLASTLKRFHPETEFHLVLAESRAPLPLLVSDPFDKVVDLRDHERGGHEIIRLLLDPRSDRLVVRVGGVHEGEDRRRVYDDHRSPKPDSAR